LFSSGIPEITTTHTKATVITNSNIENPDCVPTLRTYAFSRPLRGAFLKKVEEVAALARCSLALEQLQANWELGKFYE